MVLVEELRERGCLPREVMDFAAIKHTDGKAHSEREAAEEWKCAGVPSWVERVNGYVRRPRPSEEPPERALRDVLVSR